MLLSNHCDEFVLVFHFVSVAFYYFPTRCLSNYILITIHITWAASLFSYSRHLSIMGVWVDGSLVVILGKVEVSIIGWADLAGLIWINRYDFVISLRLWVFSITCVQFGNGVNVSWNYSWSLRTFFLICKLV